MHDGLRINVLLESIRFRVGVLVLLFLACLSAVKSSDFSFDIGLQSALAQAQPPTVTLLLPADGSVSNTRNVSLTSSVSDETGLCSSTLYIGALQTTTFSGTQQIQDTQISADQPNANFGNALSINVDGLSPHAHSLMKFPNLIGSGAGQVPVGSTISSAILQVNCTNAGNEMKIYRLTENWVEGEATWTKRSNAATWTSPGADGTGSNAGIALDGTCAAVGLQTIDLTPFIQEWSNGLPNCGILLTDSGTNGIDFTSSESGNSPVLTVVYQDNGQAIETKPLSGRNAAVTFDVTFPAPQTYFWNILVTNTAGFQGWAPNSFELTIDTSAPDQPVLISPADSSSGVSTSPTLTVSVSDPDGDPLEVIFSGRAYPPPDEFTIIALPDTQHYSEVFPEIYTAQTQWIVDNKVSRNIVFVTHLGDIVEHAGTLTEWQAANSSMSLLDGVVPYGMGPGNHDQPTTLFNQFFPFTRYEEQAWYGGHYTDKNDNNFQLFSAGGMDFLILHLEFCPPARVISWADSILKGYPERKAIITTHGYLGAGAERSVHGCTNTQYLWDGLVVPNPNVHLMLCGHVHAEARRTDNVNSHPVPQLLADYQERASGGEGWLRILRFIPAENRIHVETYSPWLNRYETDSNSQFTLDFPMGGFSTIGTRTEVPSGSEVSLVWPNLSPITQYEWGVTVTDNTGKSQTGPQWRFTTGETTVNEPPVANNQSVNTAEDTPVGIVLTATDPEGTRLTFSIVAGPTHGTLSGSAPDLTYQPSANFNGLDSFTFKANDGQVSSSVATVTISVALVNDPPSAVNDAYSLTQNSMLNVSSPGVLANDSDIDSTSLSAGLVSGTANGSLILNQDGSFTYKPNTGFAGADSFSYAANDNLANSNVATVTLTVAPASRIPILAASFDSGKDGFVYLDDAFRGTGKPGYASGKRVASGGYSGGALRVSLGGIDNTKVLGMSGGWRRSFTLSAPGQIVLTFRYKLTQSPEYESDEVSQMLVSVNGLLYGQAPNDYVAQVAGNGSGGSKVTTGWRSFQVTLTLVAGNHTLIIGAYNNKKNSTNESTTALIDDVILTTVP